MKTSFLVLLALCVTSFAIPTDYQKAANSMRLKHLPDGSVLKFNRALVLPARATEGRLFTAGYHHCDLSFEAATNQRRIAAGTEFEFEAGTLQAEAFSWEEGKSVHCGERVGFSVVSKGGFYLWVSCEDRWDCRLDAQNIPADQFEIYVPKEDIID